MIHPMDDGGEIIGIEGAADFTEQERYDFFVSVRNERLRMLRVERDRLLAATDHMALSDAPGAMTQAMRSYRQALRDITDTADDHGLAVMPVKPE